MTVKAFCSAIQLLYQEMKYDIKFCRSEITGFFIIVSFLFLVVTFRFNFKAMQLNPEKLSCIFLVSGFIFGFSDLIVSLKDQEANLLSAYSLTVAKQTGIILIAPFYGVIFRP